MRLFCALTALPNDSIAWQTELMYQCQIHTGDLHVEQMLIQWD